MKNFEKIDRFIHKKMTAQEASAFETELQKDQGLRQEYYLQQAEEAALKRHAVQQLKEQMNALEVTQKDQTQNARNTPFRKRWWIMLSCLVLGGFIYTLFREPAQNPAIPPDFGNRNLFNPNQDSTKNVNGIDSQNDSNNVTIPPSKEKKLLFSKSAQIAMAAHRPPKDWENYATRGDSPITKTPLSATYDAYESEDFSKALQFAKTVPSDSEWYLNALEIQGHSLFKLGQFRAAAQLFESFLNEKDPYKPQEWQWYLLLSYAAQLPESKAKFEALREVILANKSHLFHQDAEKLDALLK